MKKIALILALVLALSLVLVSCGGTEESKAPATSDAVSTETSKEVSTEASEEESDEEVSEEESTGPVYAEGTTEIDRTLTATVVTEGLAYNEITSTRGEGDAWAVLGTKLTDGIVKCDGGDATVFFGTSGGYDVIIDLGEKVEGLADFSASMCYGAWGISVVDSVQYFVSDDGENWLPVAAAVMGAEQTPLEENGDWKLVDFKVELEKGVSAQYVKFSITSGGHVWLGEVSAVVYK